MWLATVDVLGWAGLCWLALKGSKRNQAIKGVMHKPGVCKNLLVQKPLNIWVRLERASCWWLHNDVYLYIEQMLASSLENKILWKQRWNKSTRSLPKRRTKPSPFKQKFRNTMQPSFCFFVFLIILWGDWYTCEINTHLAAEAKAKKQRVKARFSSWAGTVVSASFSQLFALTPLKS